MFRVTARKVDRHIAWSARSFSLLMLSPSPLGDNDLLGLPLALDVDESKSHRSAAGDGRRRALAKDRLKTERWVAATGFHQSWISHG
jgi:hypothetical protein